MIQAACVQGVAPRSLGERVNAFLGHSFQGGGPYRWIETTYVRVGRPAGSSPVLCDLNDRQPAQLSTLGKWARV